MIKQIILTITFAVSIVAQEHEKIAHMIDQLYTSDGYSIGDQEIQEIKKAGGESTYGEILPQSLDALFKEIGVTSKDVFVDLGSGTGKAVMYTYLTTPVKKSIGIELASTRHKLAAEAAAALKKQGKIDRKRQLEYIKNDFLVQDLSQATIVFINSVCYSEELLKKLINKLALNKQALHLISTKCLPQDTKFELKKTLQLPMSWNKTGCNVYIYYKASK